MRNALTPLSSLALLALSASGHALLSGPFAGYPDGIVTNTFLGANAFYSRGYTGAGVVAAEIEDTMAIPGVAALDDSGRFTQRFKAEGVASTYDAHAAIVLGYIGGYSDGGAKSTGMAYGAELWSGGYDADGPNSAFLSVYHRAMISGVNGTGRTADVVSSSYGYSGDATSPYGAYFGSGAFVGTATDAVVAASNKLFVASVGNYGYDPDPFVSAPENPASGYNTLAVGATGPDSGYKARVAFSDHGYSAYYAPPGAHDDFNDPSTWGTFRTDVPRVRVDIVAPGGNLYCADPASGPDAYYLDSGTSIAAPQVAGGAALVIQAGRDLGYANVSDNRVLSAILMNSADRLAGWDNGARMVRGAWSTDQALDANVGAGQMNLARAWDQLTAGTHDLAGDGGGAVASTGWDLGALSIGGSNDYTMSLTAGMEVSALLRWNAGAGFGSLDGDTTVDDTELCANLNYGYLSDFRLELLDGSGALLAVSDAKYIATEHFVYDVLNSGTYTLRVGYLGDNYDFTGHGAVGYGLAWSQGTPQAVPEPASLAALGLGAVALLRRRRKA